MCNKRCDSCAFTPGSQANREVKNLMTAKLAVLGPFPFYCHQAIDWKGEGSGRWTRAEFQEMKAAGFTVCQGWKESVKALNEAGYYKAGNPEVTKALAMCGSEALTEFLTTDNDPDHKAECLATFKTVMLRLVQKAINVTGFNPMKNEI